MNKFQFLVIDRRSSSINIFCSQIEEWLCYVHIFLFQIYICRSHLKIRYSMQNIWILLLSQIHIQKLARIFNRWLLLVKPSIFIQVETYWIILIYQPSIQILIYKQSLMEKKQTCQEKKIEKYIFSLKKPLGQGAYATVYLGRTITNSEPVAVKVIDKAIFANAYNLKNIEHQISIMKRIDHPNIVKLLDVYQTSNNMYIVTEYCEQGDLAGWLKTKKKATQKEAIKMLKDILNGFKYLVNQQITHRDLKPANILLKNGTCKISDFGFAKDLDKGQNTVMRSIVGTPLYMSPQILARAKYTNKSDLWSVGLIYYELLHGHTPWPAKNQIQLINNIMGKPIVFDSWVSQKSKDFVRGCLRIKEDERISWEDAFNHNVVKEEKKNPIKVLMEKEDDKQNIASNYRNEERRSVSISAKRDLSQTKKNANTTAFNIERNVNGTKTPTRTRVSKIALNLTPNINNRQVSHQKKPTQLKKRMGLTQCTSTNYLRKTKLK